MNINPIAQVVKAATELTVQAGVGTIVGNLVKQSLPENLTKYKKFTVAVGGLAISGMAGAAAANYAGQQVDALVNGLHFGAAVADNVKDKLKDKKVVVVTDEEAEVIKDLHDEQKSENTDPKTNGTEK